MWLDMGDGFFKASNLRDSDLSTKDVRELQRRFLEPLARDVTRGCSKPHSRCSNPWGLSSSQEQAGCGSSSAVPSHASLIPGAQRQQRYVSPCKIYSFGCKGTLCGALVFIWPEWDLGLRLLCPIFAPWIPARPSGPHCRHNFIGLETEIPRQVSNPLKDGTNPLHCYATPSEVCWKTPARGQRAHKWEPEVEYPDTQRANAQFRTTETIFSLCPEAPKFSLRVTSF